jgi:hypothetical protein
VYVVEIQYKMVLFTSLETSEYGKRLMKRLEDAEDLLALILPLMKDMLS